MSGNTRPKLPPTTITATRAAELADKYKDQRLAQDATHLQHCSKAMFEAIEYAAKSGHHHLNFPEPSGDDSALFWEVYDIPKLLEALRVRAIDAGFTTFRHYDTRPNHISIIW